MNQQGAQKKINDSSKPVILVVEDDPSLREVISETLQLAKYHVETAENGQQALECLDSNKDIALLVSDVQMQPLDGHELLKLTKSRYPEMPVILMTAYGTIEKAFRRYRDAFATPNLSYSNYGNRQG